MKRRAALGETWFNKEKNIVSQVYGVSDGGDRYKIKTSQGHGYVVNAIDLFAWIDTVKPQPMSQHTGYVKTVIDKDGIWIQFI